MIFTFPFNSVQLLVVRVVCHGSYISLNTCVGEWEQASKDTPGTHVNVYSTWTDKVTECWRYTKRRQVDRWADRWRMKDERWQKIATKLGFFSQWYMSTNLFSDLTHGPHQVRSLLPPFLLLPAWCYSQHSNKQTINDQLIQILTLHYKFCGSSCYTIDILFTSCAENNPSEPIM